MEHDNTSIQEQTTTWQKFELVWAKLTGYPWWPGRILQLPNQKTPKYKVQFIGDNTHAFLLSNKIVAYADGWKKYSTPPKNFRGFSNACAEADQLFACTSKLLEVGKSDYSPEKTFPDQQIQIINQAELDKCEQAVTPEQKLVQINKQKYQQTQHRRPKNLSISKQRKNVPRQIISKRKQMTSRIQYVQRLLEKYNLQVIPPIDEQEYRKSENTGKRKNRFKRIQKKFKTNLTQNQIKGKLIIKIKYILRKKGIQRNFAYEIAGYMGNSLLQKRKPQKVAHRTFFQWLINNDQKTILSSYKNWQSDEQKVHLATGVTQIHEMEPECA